RQPRYITCSQSTTMAKTRGPDTTEAQRGEMLGQSKRGTNFAKIGRDIGVSADTVRGVLIREKSTGTVSSAVRSGRPQKLNDRDCRHMRRIVISGRVGRHMAFGDITGIINQQASPETIRTELAQYNINHRIAR